MFSCELGYTKIIKGVWIVFPRHLNNSSCNVRQFVSFELCILMRFKLYSAKLANMHEQINFLWLIRRCRIGDAIMHQTSSFAFETSSNINVLFDHKVNSLN